jgi:YHS domain-containing protein
MDRRRLIFAAALIGAVIGAGGLWTAKSPALAQDVNADRDGLAIYGYDPVAYFTRAKATPGAASLTATHEGATYRFASEEHRRLFLADPAKYVPVYGGFCAYGVSQGYKVKIDPEAFRIVDGRVYLNYDKSIGEKWAKDIPGYIRAANRNWPDLIGKPRSD